MRYKINYRLPPDPHLHSRYYTALSTDTALHMFEQTVEEGSLSGDSPEIEGIYKLIPAHWQKVKPKKSNEKKS